MARQLRTLRGRWLLSINDVAEIRALFAWAQIETVQTTYGIAASAAAKRAPRAELLISNLPESALATSSRRKSVPSSSAGQ